MDINLRTPGTAYADKRFQSALDMLQLTPERRALVHQELQWAFDSGVAMGVWKEANRCRDPNARDYRAGRWGQEQV